MADNVTANVGAGGATFAADDIGGVHFPRTKLIIGADGTNDGDVAAANPLPVLEKANSSTTALTLSQAVKTVAAAATPERLTAGSTKVQSVVLTACKGYNSANTGVVFIGSSGTNDLNYQRLTPWEKISLEAPPGKKIELTDIYIDVVTAGDGIAYLAMD